MTETMEYGISVNVAEDNLRYKTFPGYTLIIIIRSEGAAHY